jgi:hypothetical protein
MINPPLANIAINPYNYVRSLRKTIGPNGRLLDATTNRKPDDERWNVVARSSVDRIFCGHVRLQELVCAS